MTAANQSTYELRSSSQNTRVFLNRLVQHRTDIYAHAMGLERSDAIAAFVFDLLIRLAQHNHSFIDRSLIQRLSDQLERFEQPISEVNIPLIEGMVLTLEQALTLGAPPPSTHDIINALFARGYHIYLDSKTGEERKEFALKVIKQLPAIERLGPFRLSDYVDYACSSDESLRFWQLYVERVSAEVDRRTAQTEREVYTWTLSALLKIHDLGPNALLGKRWEVLRRHIERIMQSRQEERRWRYLRLLIESCRDHRALYFILSSPAVIEDQGIPFIFMTKGNRKLQSCALFLLHTTKVHRSQIHKVLEYFEDRSLPEIGERVVELYAQTQLFSRPSPVIEVLAEALISIVAHKIKDEPVDSLLNAVTNDAHAFRQSLFLAEVIPTDRAKNTAVHVQLLERVLQSFFHTFTPSGVRHPLNDQVYQRGVIRAIVELMRDQDAEHAAHLKSFGQTLNKAAQRWIRGDSEEEVAKRSLLLSYFIGLYIHVLRQAARHLYQKYETRKKAHELYKVMINLYLSEPKACSDSGSYEAFLPVLSTFFPEFTSSDYIEAPSETRVTEAAELLAKVEDERAQTDSFRGLLGEWQERNRGRELVESEDENKETDEEDLEDLKLEVETKGHVPIITTAPVRAPVRVYKSGRAPSLDVLQTYLGLSTARFYIKKLLAWLGLVPYGELSLVGEQIALSEKYEKNSKKIANHDLRFHISQISGVSVELPLKSFYYMFGLFALITLCFAGGHFLFAGVRGSEAELGLLGISLIAIGFAIDSAMHALREIGSKEVLLKLERHNNERPIILGVNQDNHKCQALLNAFMSESIKQKEEQFMQSLSEAAEKQREQAQQSLLNDKKQTEDPSEASQEDAVPPVVIENPEEAPPINDLEDDQDPPAIPDEDIDQSSPDAVPPPPEDELDISFEDDDDDEDEDEDEDDRAFEPMTVVPPVPVLANLDEASGADLAQISEILDPNRLASPEKNESELEAEETAATELADVQVDSSSEEGLSNMFDFVTSLADSSNKDSN